MSKHHKRSSLYQLIDRKKFDRLCAKWGMDKGVRSFSTWEMTQALLSCFVLRLSSYREVEGTLNIPDSTFGDALRDRCSGFFEDLCDQVLFEIKAKTESRKIKKAVRQILAVDSTECRVHGSLFNQPRWQQKSGGKKAAVKLHVVWNVNAQWIEDFQITGCRKHDLTAAKAFALSDSKIYVFDRAYMDLKFWLDIIESKSHFVTRLKNTPRRAAVHKFALNEDHREKCGVLWEGGWTPSEAACYRQGIKPKQLKLRHIIYRDPLSRRVFDFITSDWIVTAQSIADIYKKRWAVELLFRWLKGHLDIRFLPARTKNAIRTQLAVAVLVQLLLQLKRLNDQFKGTLWDLLRKIRTTSLQKSIMGSGFPDDCRWSPATTAPHRELSLCK
jgi:hypothetical protein